MCGRYALTDLKALLKEDRFQLETFPPNLSPRYNIAPSQQVPAILNQAPRRAYAFVEEPSTSKSTGRRREIV